MTQLGSSEHNVYYKYCLYVKIRDTFDVGSHSVFGHSGCSVFFDLLSFGVWSFGVRSFGVPSFGVRSFGVPSFGVM
jgi:hypothetical protein